jgi:hypothetical protein
MNSNAVRNSAGPLSGNLLQLGGSREIAIYLRNGVPWVAEFTNGRGAVSSLSGWFGLHGRALVHAQRRGEVEIISPIPKDVVARIQRIHLVMEERMDVPKIWRSLAGLVRGFRARSAA